jgi:hypothetical protein
MVHVKKQIVGEFVVQQKNPAPKGTGFVVS